MARKLFWKVVIQNCRNGQLNSPNGHPNGPNGPIGCLYQSSCKFWVILIDNDPSDLVPILKEACSMRAAYVTRNLMKRPICSVSVPVLTLN